MAARRHLGFGPTESNAIRHDDSGRNHFETIKIYNQVINSSAYLINRRLIMNINRVIDD